MNNHLHFNAPTHLLALGNRRWNRLDLDVATQLSPLLQLRGIGSVDGINLACDSFVATLLALILRPSLLDG